MKSQRQKAKESTITKIVKAAEKLFFSKGIAQTTMDEIATLANCSKATLYSYFPSKEELIFAIAKKGNEKCQSMLTKAASSFNTGADKVRAIGYEFFNFAATYPDYYHYLSLYVSIDLYKMDDENAKALLNIDKILAENIEIGIQDGTIKDSANADVIAKCLWFMAHGLIQFISNKGELLESATAIKTKDMLSTCFIILEDSLAVDPQYRGLIDKNPHMFDALAKKLLSNKTKV